GRVGVWGGGASWSVVGGGDADDFFDGGFAALDDLAGRRDQRQHPLLDGLVADGVLVDVALRLHDDVADGAREVERLGDGLAALVADALARRAVLVLAGPVEVQRGDLLRREA